MTTSSIASPGREDPIQKRYYDQAEVAETASAVLFYVSAVLSFMLLIVDKTHATFNSIAITLFVLAALGQTLLGVITRHYLLSRAETARRQDFLSNAFGFNLTHERTVGYYNNSETEPFARMALLTLENLHFTRNILRRMAPAARAKVGIYGVAWIAFVVWRATPIDWIVTAAQVVLAEDILARWVRLERALSRADDLYDRTYQLFQSQAAPDKIRAYALAAFGEYEASKSSNAILQPTKLFEALNPSLSSEWERIRGGLLASLPVGSLPASRESDVHRLSSPSSSK